MEGVPQYEGTRYGAKMAISSVPVSVLERRLADARTRLAVCEVEVRILEELISSVAGDQTTPSSPLDTPYASTPNGGMTARDAILELVDRTPGLTPTQIADRLAGKIDSRAVDQRNVIRTTVARLAAQGVIRRDEANRNFPSERRPAE